MSTTSLRIPKYRRHKASGQAVATIAGRDVYLGTHGSAASRREYGRLIAEWQTSDGTLATNDLALAELVTAYRKHAKRYYRGPDGKATPEVGHINRSLEFVRELYLGIEAAAFGPRALKAVRDSMIAAGLARKTINDHVGRIKRMFKWGVEHELIKPDVLHALQAVAGLRCGRTEARESEPVKPVHEAHVDAVLPHVSRQVAAMIDLQRLTGMRPGEVATMRTGDLNTAGDVWVYTPQRHKNTYRGHTRQIFLGPRAQAILRPFLKADLAAYMFSPAEAEAERQELRYGSVRPDRKTKVYPCELRARAKRRAARQRRNQARARDRYDAKSYRQAVRYGIAAANRARLAEAEATGVGPDVQLVPSWHPHQLRHNAATRLRREYGLDVAQIILGHRTARVTEIYAEVESGRARDVMVRNG